MDLCVERGLRTWPPSEPLANRPFSSATAVSHDALDLVLALLRTSSISDQPRGMPRTPRNPIETPEQYCSSQVISFFAFCPPVGCDLCGFIWRYLGLAQPSRGSTIQPTRNPISISRTEPPRLPRYVCQFPMVMRFQTTAVRPAKSTVATRRRYCPGCPIVKAISTSVREPSSRIRGPRFPPSRKR